MEAMVSARAQRRIPAALVTAVITVLIWSAHLAVREATNLEAGAPLRLAMTGALVLAFAVHVIVTARLFRRQFDEFQQAIHMTALAFAFPASMIAMFAIGFFRAEGLLADMDPRDLVMLMLLAYAGGLAWAWRRYEK
jgi:hypothetical protein